MSPIFLIVNPISGRGYAQRVLPEIEKKLREFRVDYHFTFTERPWHAAELAEQAARQGYDAVVVASGDGTANEALNGLMRAVQAGFDKTAMGVIAVGTGNDFAYGMGIPSGVEAGCKILARNYRRRVDIGLVKGGDYPQGRYFGNGVGIGFDAATGFVAAKIRHLRGMLLYLIAALQTILIYYKAPHVRVELDGEVIETPSLMVSVMNGQRMGGGFFMAPQGNTVDGIFDICLARSAGRMRILSLIPYFIKGTQATQKEVSMHRARRVVVTALQGTLPAHCDGETVCYAGKELHMEILPAQIEFITQAPTT
ncbi:MAG: diacylglycerol kinase family lipid kinase [Anaerolineales bacterium]|nr:diacylglycerol kinase family lipid kinase [Anaerolineales bacterium]MCX7609584.1 diacylglycerol kinase family lipid kinase [Anaerolineales bacterium]